MPTDDDKFMRQALHIFAQFATEIRCSPEDLAKERGAVLEVALQPIDISAVFLFVRCHCLSLMNARQQLLTGIYCHNWDWRWA